MRFPVLVMALVLAGCGGGDALAPEPPPAPPSAPPQSDACSVGAQRQSLVGYMSERYLWNSQLAAPDTAAPGMAAYFDSLLYKPVDRYSYTQTLAAYSQVYTFGRRVGYGYALAWDGEQLRVRYVEPASPVALAGLRRGDTVLAIDGLTPQQIAQGLLPAVTEGGVTRRFRVAAEGGEREFVVLSAEYPMQSLPLATVVDVQRPDGGAVKVGYLVLHQFVNHAQLALNEAMNDFAAAEVNEVVIDLRYNGGGSIFFSQQLASMLATHRAAGELYAGLRHNAGQQERNSNYRILPVGSLRASPLTGIDRVLVIASGSTASASELLINGLRPFMPVVLLGSRTYGKPFGSTAREHCGTVYQAIQFETVNSKGEGGYTNGFAPDCEVPDDLDHELGDVREGRLSAALEYIRTGSCPVQPQSFALRHGAPKDAGAVPLGEAVPPGMFAD